MKNILVWFALMTGIHICILGVWCSYHCKTIVCSNTDVLSYTSPSVSSVHYFLECFDWKKFTSTLRETAEINSFWFIYLHVQKRVASFDECYFNLQCHTSIIYAICFSFLSLILVLISSYIPSYTFSWLVPPMWWIIST